MTSDAKIGLLLGLVFIFVIAFVINGLPSFREATNGNELTTNMVSSQRDTFGIGTNERKVQEGFDWTGQPIEEPVVNDVTPPPVEEEKEDIRFRMPIPDDIAIVEETPTEITPELVEQTLAQSIGPTIEADDAEAVAAEIDEPVETIAFELPPKEPEPKPAPRALAKIYTVANGDTLGAIAQKVYGREEGNKLANVRRIFEANLRTLKSMDEVVVGQKIVIPPLRTSEPDAGKPEGVFASSLFEEAKSIGRRLFSGDKPEPELEPKAKPAPVYVVRDGDNLWRVAARQLGDATRYKEIVRLNPGVLKSENTTLDIGMQLNLPAQ